MPEDKVKKFGAIRTSDEAVQVTLNLVRAKTGTSIDDLVTKLVKDAYPEDYADAVEALRVLAERGKVIS